MSKAPVPDRRPMFQKLTEVDRAEVQIGQGPVTVTPPATMQITEIVDGTGTLVGVRIQPGLLARLDAYRGGKTRPQAIRELLEKHLERSNEKND